MRDLASKLVFFNNIRRSADSKYRKCKLVLAITRSSSFRVRF